MQKFITLTLIAFLSVSLQAQDFSKLNDWLDDHTPEMGGRAVLMIYKDGKVIYSEAVNEMSRRQKAVTRALARRANKPVNSNDYSTTTRVPIASCSKWLSAALVMSFVDEGKLKLDDTVGKFLPVLSQHGKGNITISQCLSHTTGIKSAGLKENLAEMKDISSMDEAMEKLASLPMEGEPGTVFHYSNAGLQIAGAVIEKIGGKSFQKLFAERIARPLEMKNTDWGEGKVALPAGGARSTAQDYLNFLVMILNKGTYKGKRILSESAIAQMQINRITNNVRVAYSPAEAGNAGYGYGEWIMSDCVSSPGLFGSFPWVDNNRNYCGILITTYIKSEGRGERYKEMKKIADEAIK